MTSLARWLRKNALIAIMLLVTALAFLSLAISAFVFEAQEKMAKDILASYVSDLAETFVESPAAGGHSWPQRGAMRGRMMGEHHMQASRMRIFFRMLSTDPSIRSGGVLLLNRDKRPVGASEGAEALERLWRDDLPLSGVSTVRDENGTEYQVAVRPLPSGHFILVAASRANLLGSIARLWNTWVALVMAVSVAMLACAVALWRYLVLPMRQVVEVIGVTHWGRELPDFGKPWLYEVRALTGVIGKAAVDAVAKEGMRARYVGDIVRVQEEARRRFARELHDGPLQSVVASIKNIQLAQNVYAHDGARARERLDEAERISQSAADEIRDFCEELSPSWLALGLSNALDELAERLEAAHNVRIDVQLGEIAEDLTDECVLALVRIMQEAVSNSARHGGAARIEVQLREAGENSVFTIADDGRGFAETIPSDHERLRVEGHRGLSNMHERAQLLGGGLSVLPYGIDGGHGGTIVVTLPNGG